MTEQLSYGLNVSIHMRSQAANHYHGICSLGMKGCSSCYIQRSLCKLLVYFRQVQNDELDESCAPSFQKWMRAARIDFKPAYFGCGLISSHRSPVQEPLTVLLSHASQLCSWRHTPFSAECLCHQSVHTAASPVIVQSQDREHRPSRTA